MEPDQENPQTQLLLHHHHHHHHNHQNLDHQVETHVGIGINGSSSSSGKSGSSTYMCRQSSARWTPTSDQIRILKDLYYNNGVRSPSAEQIQRISARLRQYGKIEGKNVFYWFQNHKARERQKKRFTVDTNHLHPMLPTPPPIPPPQPMQLQIGGGGGGFGWKPTHEQQQHQMDIHTSTTKYMTAPNINPGVSCPSSPCSSHGVLSTTTVGQIGCNGYGSVLMEKSFRDCSISAGGSSVIGPLTNNNLGWVGNVGIDHHHHHHLYSSTSSTPPPPPPASSSSSSYSYPLFTNTKSSSSSVQIFQNVESSPVQMETLPLFPIHREQEDDQEDMSASGFCIQGGIYPPSSSSGFCIQGINPASNPSGGYNYNNITSSNRYRPNDHIITAAGSSTSRTSLELSLYSYSGMSPHND